MNAISSYLLPFLTSVKDLHPLSVIVLKLHIFVFFSETFGSIGKLKIYLHKLQKQVEKQAFVELYCPISQRVQINYIFSVN
jgi:hypothetical protein